jgi:hypothetical protein
MGAKPDGGRGEGAVMRFVERFALTFSESGVPRIPARVFVALIASDEGRLTAAELAEILKVGHVEREPGERCDHYRVFSDTLYEMLVRWQGDLREGIEAVGADTPAGKRLEENRRYHAFLREEIPKPIKKWRRIRSEPDTGGTG